jgi:hypothetical protein
MVLQYAFTWLDLSTAHSPEACNQWVSILRELLTIGLHRRPRVRKGQAQTHDDLPSNFEQFVFRLVARALPYLRPHEDPASFWRPILDLGAPAHYWIEHFFWEWFTEGIRQPQAPENFTRIWSEMVHYATLHPLWMPGQRHSYHLATMVSELLGFSKSGTTVASDPRFAESIKR